MADPGRTDLAFLEGKGGWRASSCSLKPGAPIAGGTSEIKRNQIGERILGCPATPW